MGGRLVGHARPDRVARAVFHDSEPRGAGGDINDRLSVEGDEIPIPPWDSFEVAEQVDLLTGHCPHAARLLAGSPICRGLLGDGVEILHREKRLQAHIHRPGAIDHERQRGRVGRFRNLDDS